MPALGDYLGALLAEITNARLQTDLESARIAQLYASHPLLQHMPVPRFRLPNVVLNLPVAVESADQPPDETAQKAELPALRQRIEGIIERELSQRKLQLTPGVRRRLTRGLGALFDRLKKSGSLSASDLIKTSDDAVAATVRAMTAIREDRAATDSALESSLRQQFGAEFLKLQPPPLRVQVLVATAQLKDFPASTLTRIQLTISEEGVEWTQTNPSDPSAKTLMPE